MDTTSRRYTSPARPPRLISRAGESRPAATRSPLLCLHCAGSLGHAPPRLVTFEWGRVSFSRRGR